MSSRSEALLDRIADYHCGLSTVTNNNQTKSTADEKAVVEVTVTGTGMAPMATSTATVTAATTMATMATMVSMAAMVMIATMDGV